jgi:protein-S-isoprenylcysteine O-methyltransferase Ste14
LCGIGAFLKSMTIWGLILLATLTAFLYATARVEEKDNMKKFGVEYQEYQRRTKMFIPFLY